MRITPDTLIYWQNDFITLNATIVFTWIVMLLLVLGSWLVTRHLTSDADIPHRQNLLECIVLGIIRQIQEITPQDATRFLPFIGTLFLFIAVSNLLAVVPGFQPPTGSLSTTIALAICVFVAVPVFGIYQNGLPGYFKNYIDPTPVMLPFNIIGEISRTIALAVRLFGNIMSGSLIAAILLSVMPLLVPVVMQLFGLLTGMVQAYIFAILAAVYIAAGQKAHEKK
jgi:F-type H+-transporting ATPase subunit a